MNDEHYVALNERELATCMAALLFWKEEMCPHSTEVMRPYMPADLEPLTAAEIERLSERLGSMLPRSPDETGARRDTSPLYRRRRQREDEPPSL